MVIARLVFDRCISKAPASLPIQSSQTPTCERWASMTLRDWREALADYLDERGRVRIQMWSPPRLWAECPEASPGFPGGRHFARRHGYISSIDDH